MAISELNHINIRTNLMEETKDFFVDVVGLEVGDRPPFDSHGYWLYCDGIAIVHLSLSDPAGDRRTVAEGRGDGLDHIGLFAHDLAGTEETLSTHDVTYCKRMAAGGRLIQVFFSRPQRGPGRAGLRSRKRGGHARKFRARGRPRAGCLSITILRFAP